MTVFADADFSQLNAFLQKQNPSKIFILTDENTHEYCLPVLLPHLELTAPFEILEIEAGEEMKTIETAVHLWEILAEFSADRQSLLLNVGGGVITDLGGFVASTYKRGIPFLHIPTTLLAMCDAAVGGKTGIDHLFLKNLVGTFSPPEQIYIFPDFLKTLPQNELRSGFAEMLKHGLIADAGHWKDLVNIKELSVEAIAPLIARSIAIKEDVVAEDPLEKNVRKTLNFGHTIGHALESLFLREEKPIMHGEAVAAGMICETCLAAQTGLLKMAQGEKIISHILRFFPILDIHSFSEEEILTLISHDKKNTGGQFKFALITQPGKCAYNQAVSGEEILAALKFYRNL